MLLPLALLYDDQGKLISVRYLKFDAPIANAQALANTDYNEIMEYKPAQPVLLNTGVVEIPIDSFIQRKIEKLQHIKGITRVDADGAVKGTDWTQIITPKDIDYSKIEQLVSYWQSCYAKFSNYNQLSKADDAEYEIIKLQDTPASAGYSRIIADNGGSIYALGSTCTVYAIDYTGKLFKLPIASVVELQKAGKISVGNMIFENKLARRASSTHREFANVEEDIPLTLVDAQYSIYKQRLDNMCTLNGQASITEKYTEKYLQPGSSLVILPKGVTDMQLVGARDAEQLDSVRKLVCPKTMNSVVFDYSKAHLDMFAAPEEVISVFYLRCASINQLVLPKKFLRKLDPTITPFISPLSGQPNRRIIPVTEYYGKIFYLAADNAKLDKISFDYSLVEKYEINIGMAPELKYIALPVRQAPNRYATSVDINLGIASKFETLMLYRALNEPVIKPYLNVTVMIEKNNYTIDLRLPVRYLDLSFPASATNYSVTIKHCGISNLIYHNHNKSNSIVLVPNIQGASVNNVSRAREKGDVEAVPAHIIRQRTVTISNPEQTK